MTTPYLDDQEVDDIAVVQTTTPLLGSRLFVGAGRLHVMVALPRWVS
jgi:hypothetical protein